MFQNILVILAGGMGVRYNAKEPKQYTLINDKTLLEHSLDEMRESVNTDRIVLVINNDPEKIEFIKQKYDIDVIVGGSERANSFQNAIDYVSETYKDCKKIVFHEAARPLVGHSVIDKYFELLDEYDYVESCKKISDSLGSHVIKAPRREDYFLIQAPEAYRFSILKQYFDYTSDIYFAANQFPDFVKGYQYYDIPYNIKLTNPQDKILIEYILNHID